MESEKLRSLHPETEPALGLTRSFVRGIFDYHQMRGFVNLGPELTENIVQAIPEDVLRANSAFGIISIAANTSVTTHFGLRRDQQGELQSITSSEELWGAIQRNLCHEILDCNLIRAKILKPFFIAHWTECPEVAKLKPSSGEPPERHWLEPDLSNENELPLYLEEWRELIALGVIRMVWDEGETICHFELDADFFDAFKDGIPDGKLSKHRKKQAHNFFNRSQPQE